MPIFDKILFLLAHFRVPFLLNSVVFLFDSSFEMGSLRGCASSDLKKMLKYTLNSNGAIWCAFVTKYFTWFIFFFSFSFKNFCNF